MSYPPQCNGAIVGNLESVLANQTTFLARLTAARAGYLDELAAANLPTDVGNLLIRLTAARAGYLDNIDNVVLKTLAAMRGTDGAALASSWTAALATALGNYNATRAGYMDALNRQRPNMIFTSEVTPIIILPAAAADLDFPSVVVSGLPAGITIAKADFVLVIGSLLDTSAAENQIDQAAKTIRCKLSTGDWATPADQIVALTFGNNGLQCGASAYRGGCPLFGAADIKSIVTADGTYNFRSEETNNSEGVTVTGASLECLDVSSIIRVWFN